LLCKEGFIFLIAIILKQYQSMSLSVAWQSHGSIAALYSMRLPRYARNDIVFNITAAARLRRVATIARPLADEYKQALISSLKQKIRPWGPEVS
jgi:hypothetical protein